MAITAGMFRNTRDFQRARVYRSENIMEESKDMLGKRLETVREMQLWVDKILKSKWFKVRWPYLTSIEVKDGRGRRIATGYARGIYSTENPSTEGIIKMPKWSRCEMIIIHEVAHVITDHEYMGRVPAHGIQFCNLYLNMVRRFMGTGWHAQLKDAFKKEKVKFRMVNT